MKKILFLDFDGVLHPATGNLVPEFAYAPALAGVLHGSDCQVVISSTWREHYPLEKLKGLLPAEMRDLVVGCTGQDVIGRFCRQLTIEAYVRALTDACDWIAVDDSRSEFECLDNVVLCDGQLGLQQPQLDQIAAWLRHK